jgi:hypothetical protein
MHRKKLAIVIAVLILIVLGTILPIKHKNLHPTATEPSIHYLNHMSYSCNKQTSWHEEITMTEKETKVTHVSLLSFSQIFTGCEDYFEAEIYFGWKPGAYTRSQSWGYHFLGLFWNNKGRIETGFFLRPKSRVLTLNRGFLSSTDDNQSYYIFAPDFAWCENMCDPHPCNIFPLNGTKLPVQECP